MNNSNPNHKDPHTPEAGGGFCDLRTGACGEAEDSGIEAFEFVPPAAKITLYYITDPICSHCWALEPSLNRFLWQYGRHVRLHTVMGGLLPGWEGFADRANGIGQPSDVAQHWREVGQHSRMPIDGSLWLTDPIRSSYPPCRVFKVIQARYPGRENEFLRRAREDVFVFDRNIGEEKILIQRLDEMGLDGRSIMEEAGTEEAQNLLEQDFALSARLGVRGFPTIVMADDHGQAVKISGVRPLNTYIEGLERLLGRSIEPEPVPELANWMQEELTLFAKEIEVMYDLEPKEVESFVTRQLEPGQYGICEILDELLIQNVREKTN
ncbi:dithiol-disulfide isomerase [Saccharibacillus sp. O16]|nr:dithiol-disulfide isomerase [Saccharibacillus sp. O16]